MSPPACIFSTAHWGILLIKGHVRQNSCKYVRGQPRSIRNGIFAESYDLGEIFNLQACESHELKTEYHLSVSAI